MQAPHAPRVRIELSVSLDGFSAGPAVSAAAPMGLGGEQLHERGTGDAAAAAIDDELAEAFFARTGAFLIGRTTFDLGEPLWGPEGAFRRPCFVVTHRPRPPLVRGPTTFTFVGPDVAAAVQRARDAAGARDVCIMGGARLAGSCLRAGLVDALHLHVRDVFLGAGTRLFDDAALAGFGLVDGDARRGCGVTHLRYRVARRAGAIKG